LTRIDPWFLYHIRQIVDMRTRLMDMARQGLSPKDWDADLLKRIKEYGFSDVQLARLFRTDEEAIRRIRKRGVEPVYKLVDTCAAEFEAYTPYYYSTYEQENEIRRSDRKKVVILGGGPNRIGQGIEFDYCCVQASFALRKWGSRASW
jgi:carbamoyl-phosphate synthase large subunit